MEDGTRLAAQVRRGVLPATDDDDLSDKYVIAEQRLTAAGHTAYEVSNWSSECGNSLPAQSGLLAKSSLVGHRSRRS